MNRTRSGLIAAALLMTLTTAGRVDALDIALPDDFPAYQVQNLDPGNSGYYYASMHTTTAPPELTKAYAFLMRPDGSIAWFFTDQLSDKFFNHYTDGRLVLGARQRLRGSIAIYKHLLLFDEAATLSDTAAAANPFRPSMKLDLHEVKWDADGNLWTLWLDPAIVDMSEIWPGGQPNTQINHATIQRWSPGGDLLWEWRSLDHTDALPYTARLDTSALSTSFFEHLHANSFQILPDGDLLVNALSLNTTFRVDFPSGEVLWRLGGLVNDFTWTTDLEIPPDVRVPFKPAHTAWLYPDGRLSIFDNGGWHDVPRAYGKVYQLDTDAMTADLIWYYHHPLEFASSSQGSFQLLPDGGGMLGWGALTNGAAGYRNATEVTATGEIVWDIRMWDNPEGTGDMPPTYRWYKLQEDEFIPPEQPYLCETSDADTGTLTLWANWFGHQDEVAGYRFRWGLTPDNLDQSVDLAAGSFVLEDADPLTPYYCRAIPLGGNGEPMGPPSNLLRAQVAITELDLEPLVQLIPASGGTVVYNANFTSVSDALLNFTYLTKVVLPSGVEYGPLMQIPFVMFPNSSFTANSLTQAVPGWAPSGTYYFLGRVLNQASWPIAEAYFPFYKQGTVGVAPSYHAANDWLPGGDLGLNQRQAPSCETARASDEVEPFALEAVHPNPFNDQAAVTIELREPSPLRVELININGRRVQTLADGVHPAGRHQLAVEARGLASGVYFVRVSVPGAAPAVKKVLLLR